jgi:colanic acid/amylovoran biosynthesis glycosyltransferase
MSNDNTPPQPLVISLCGTFLKPEMQSIYRQVSGFKRVRTHVYTQSLENTELFPFEPVTILNKLPRPRLKGNFLLRYWYKHVTKQWPPPRPINREVKPYHAYNLVERLRADDPDLVHVYYGHKAVHFLDMLLDWGGRFVVSFHGVDVAKFIDRPGYLEKLQDVFSKATLLMGRSQSLLERLDFLGCPESKLRLNRTPIPLDHLPSTVKAPPQDGAWRLVQACRLIPKKGILTTLRALAVVKPRYPNLKYVLCGEGPLKEKIQQKARELDLEENLEFLGWLDQAALLEQYQKAHLFLHASETTKDSDQEGIPNSMLEAMATGLPVIATNHGGIPEAVTHGHDGLLAPEASPNELSAQLLAVMADATMLSRLSKNAAASVRANFGSDAQIAALEDVYFEAMGRKIGAGGAGF